MGILNFLIANSKALLSACAKISLAATLLSSFAASTSLDASGENLNPAKTVTPILLIERDGIRIWVLQLGQRLLPNRPQPRQLGGKSKVGKARRELNIGKVCNR
jgi:hypothetical protein